MKPYTSILLLLALPLVLPAQQSKRDEKLPKDVRGYKVHRAQVEPKQNDSANKKKKNKDDYDETEPLLVRLGEARLISASPLGVTFEVPVVLAAVKQQGDIDRLVFEDMVVNDIAVSIDDYVHPFALPNKDPMSLAPPLRILVSTPQAMVRTIDELLDSRDLWTVTGRIYVCGQFRKYLIKFKRAVPVELQTTINNPLQ